MAESKGGESPPSGSGSQVTGSSPDAVTSGSGLQEPGSSPGDALPPPASAAPTLPRVTPVPDFTTIVAPPSPGPPPTASHIPRLPVTAAGEVFGDYEILAEIARGGMGIVYRARQRTLNRIVALKVLLAGQGATDDQVKRFHREASAAARLQHPAIVQVYDVGIHEGTHYYSMEYVEGRTFLDMIEREHPSPRVAADIVRRVAEALGFAHDSQLIHRDIKPQNILVDTHGNPHLSDFGLVKDFSEKSLLTASGTALGTPAYMSPEQALGDSARLDARSDIFSLGSVLYHALTGHPPFDGETALSVMNRVVATEPRPMKELSREVNRDLETICLKAMAKHPNGRYRSAREMAEDLERFLDGRLIRARRAGPFERLGRVVWRNKALSAIAAVAALALLGGAVLLVVMVRAREAERRRGEASDLVQRAVVATRRVSVPRTGDRQRDEEAAGVLADRFRRAIDDVGRALALDPESRLALRTHADLLLRTGRNEAALHAFDRLAQALRDDDGVRYLRACVLCASGPGGRAPAAATLGELCERRPASQPLGALARARTALQAGRVGENDRDGVFDWLKGLDPKGLDPALGVDPAEPWRLRAYAYGAGGSGEGRRKAVEAMTRFLETGEGSYFDYVELARWQSGRGAWNEAEQAFLEAMARTDNPVNVLLEWARMHRDRARKAETSHGDPQADRKAAERLYARVISQQADPLMPLLHRAEMFVEPRSPEERNYPRAHADYLRALELRPDDPEVLTRILHFYADWKGGPDAQAFYREARGRGALDPVRLAGGSADTIAHLADVLIDVKLYDEAAELLRLGLVAHADSAGLFALAGQLHYRRKAWAEAVRDFDQALKLAPQQSKYYVWRSRCRGKLKDGEGVLRDLTRAIAVDPTDLNLYLRRGLRYFHDWKLEPGLADIEHATLLAELDKVDRLRRDLQGKGPSEWFEELDEGVRRTALAYLPKLSERLSVRGEEALAQALQVQRGPEAEREAALKEAQQALERARAVDPTQPRPAYGLARVAALRRNWGEAAHLLEDALELGYRDAAALEQDEALRELRARPEWERVQAKLLGDKR